MRVLVLMDAFKGSISSVKAGEAVRQGFLAADPATQVEVCPFSDGGEGMMDAFLAAGGGRRVGLTVNDPLGRPVEAEYALLSDGTAVVECAKALGLYLLRPEERNPLQTSSYGLGEILLHALQNGADRILLGLGGSATNDGGMGMLSALGFVFTDAQGNVLKGCGKDLESVAAIRSVVQGVQISAPFV